MNGNATTILRALLYAGLSLTFAACSWNRWFSEEGYLMPDDEGLYAVNGEELHRMDGNAKERAETWPERSNLAPSTRFVVYQSALEYRSRAPDDLVRLYKVGWTRSRIGEDGSIRPVTGSPWATPELESFAIPLAIRPVDSRKDVLLATPKQALEPGLYTLRVRTADKPVSGRVGIRWSSVNHEDYSAQTCVDLYADGSYRRCGEQAQVLTTAGLALYLVNPEKRTDPAGQTIVVRGVIVNTSSQARRVPQLEGQLRSVDGQIVRQWRFSPQSVQLSPGQSTTFRSETPKPPVKTHDVYVRFAGMQSDQQ